MRKLDKKLLEKQGDVFLAVTARFKTGSESRREWVEMFIKWTSKEDIVDVTEEDVDLFAKFVYDKTQRLTLDSAARVAINQMRKFYVARSKNIRKGVGGRPPFIDQIKYVQSLREKYPNFSLTELGALANPKKPIDKAQVHRWLKFSLKRLG